MSKFLKLFTLIPALSLALMAQSIPAPKDVLGFTPGDDRKLASWTSIVEYFQKLDAASDRLTFQEIGKTTIGASFVYATISSPENLKNLETIKKVNAMLADPRTFKSSDITAKRYIGQGKTIVLITCGVHSNEVGSTLSSMLIAHRLTSSNEPEIQNILKNTIVLLVPSLNPDGVDIIKNWYDKTLGTPYEGTDPPELYHKYVGHDDNRDWYAFTQVETQLTVDKIHNVWHPQIVHDIHQQGANGSRLFLPPYMQPVEPNVPKQIVEGYTELGNYMAKDLRGKGFEGITTDSTYDAWTPSRAYSHYHGGVRILSETASCKLATPVTIKYDDLRNGLGYDVRKETPNFGPVWNGGEWHIRDITNYMTTAAFSLMKHAAVNRAKWLTRFYAIGKEAVRPRKNGEVLAYVIDSQNSRYESTLTGALEKAGVEIESVGPFTSGKKKYPNGTLIIRANQPYASFAKALIEVQQYPNLRDAKGDPIPPYDVTAHSMSLLTDTKVESVSAPFVFPGIKGGNGMGIGDGNGGGCEGEFNYKTYHSEIPVIDEGWSRWVIEKYDWMLLWYNPQLNKYCRKKHSTISNAEILKGKLADANNVIIFPDQSPNSILNGYAKGSMPDKYTGGLGKEGAANLKKFAEAGGTLIFLNRSSDFAIEQFGLPVKDVTDGLPRKDFYIPGSILRIELDTDHPATRRMPAESIAWFEGSPAFEIKTDPLALSNNFRIIARYPTDPKKILLSGWALGAEKIAGKAALVEFKIGKGKIYLFGFRPQYRGQSLATFPLFFNAIGN
jgi:Zinc carboxypeptidase